MPSAEEKYSAEGYRVFIQRPASRIKEDLNRRIRADPKKNNCRKLRRPSEKRLNFCQDELNFVLSVAFISESPQNVVITKIESISLTKHPCLCPRLIAA